METMSDRKVVSVDRGWLLVMTDLGVDWRAVLRRAGQPDDLFAHEGAKLTAREFFRLWQSFDAEVDDPLLPIRLAEAMTTEAFHPMVFAALCSPNLVVAVERIARYKRLLAPVTVTAEEREDGFFIADRWDDVDAEMPPSLVAKELAMYVRIARIGARRRIEPLRVVCPHRVEPEAYRAFYGVAPARGGECGVTFSMADATMPFATASESLWKTFEPELQRSLSRIDRSMPLRERVHSALLESLPSGEASIEVIARRLGLSPRTLQRRLKPESISFKQIVRETREKLARHYLTNTELGYAEISFLIGFEEPSSFFRAFREWTGVTPESMRVSAGN